MLDRAVLLESTRRSNRSAAIVCQLGDAGDDLRYVADDPGNLYLLGSMGMVVPVALGIALRLDTRVIAVEGDGGCLMNLGALTTAARYGPANLSILILDNGSYGTTGWQPSATRTGADLAGVGRAAGLKEVRSFDRDGAEDELSWWLDLPGLRLAVARTGCGKGVPDRGARLLPTQIRTRFVDRTRPQQASALHAGGVLET